jgi:galactokinase
VTVPRALTLGDAGLSVRAAGRKAGLFRAAALALTGDAGDMPPLAFFVPGRIEVLGKHTDYCGGRSLLCAVEQGFCLVARARRDRLVRVVDAVSGDVASCALDPAAKPVRGRWSNYPATVARRVARNFPQAVTGADIAFISDLPQASGMSSSSAFMIGVFLVLAEVNALARSPEYLADIDELETLAGYLATIENGRSFGALDSDLGVGTFGGSEDHTAILCGRPDMLSQYRFDPVVRERDVAMPADHAFVVAFSGVVAEKTGAALTLYNRASRSAAVVLERWRAASGSTASTLEAAVTEVPDAPVLIRRALAAAGDRRFSKKVLLQRFDQFLLESRWVIPSAGDALAAGDLTRFGALVDQSQDAAERWLGNQVPETVELARHARELGARAASAFGAGFGGSVWALVRQSDVPSFITAWKARYQEQFPAAAAGASFFETRPGPAARRIMSIEVR